MKLRKGILIMTQKNSKEYVFNYIKDLGSELISGEYINNSSKLKVVCTDCGEEFETSFKAITRRKNGLTCRKCSFKKVREVRYLKYDDIRDYVENCGCELISNEYINQNTKMKFKCSCGNEFTTTFDTFKYQGKHQCNECSKKQIHDKRAYSYKYVENYIKNLGSELLSETYNDNHEKIKVRCNKCKKVFETTFDIILTTVRKKDIKILNCKKCNCKDAQAKNLHTIEEIRDFVNKNSDCELLSTEYKSNKSKNNKLEFQCSCGNKFKTTYYRFKYKNKRQCNKCSQKEKWTIERAKQWVLDNSDCILLEKEYKNNNTKMLFKCKCGNEFKIF